MNKCTTTYITFADDWTNGPVKTRAPRSVTPLTVRLVEQSDPGKSVLYIVWVVSGTRSCTRYSASDLHSRVELVLNEVAFYDGRKDIVITRFYNGSQEYNNRVIKTTTL